ncbi:MAG: Hpt domain-containing protein, partial [Myxococcota bacterium]
MDAQEELLQIFKAEVAEVLEKIASHLERDAAHWDLELLFRWAHSLKGSARIVGEKTVEQIGHSLEDAFGAIRERGAISREVVDVIRQGYALLERIIYEPDEDLEALVDGFDEEIARSLGAKSSEEIVLSHGESASMGGTSSPHGTRGKEDNDRVASVRIAEEKIDYLSELAAGYLTVSHGLRAHGTFFREVIAGLNGISRRMPALSGDDEYGRLLERLKRAEKEFDSTRRYHERATEDFQWGLRQLRMMRIGSLRGLFSRTIREIARSTGKHAQLVIEGQDTEVDRVVLGSLRDSLVHLVRNAVAHGIESPEERAESRKPKYGTITLRARVSGSWVLLEIADDGRGVDLEAVRRRALESEALTPTEVDSA